MQTLSQNPPAVRGPTDHEVRDQIVLAATQHFQQFGYEKTTVSDLAKAIGFSKAYVYKFFASKQAIGEMICANCLHEIERETRVAITQTDRPPEQLKRLFQSAVASSLKLLVQDRKLYEIAISAATERWQSTLDYEARMQALLREILVEGRRTGDFERKTPLDEAAAAIALVLRPYLNPLMLQYGADHAQEASSQLASLVLRSLSP